LGPSQKTLGLMLSQAGYEPVSLQKPSSLYAATKRLHTAKGWGVQLSCGFSHDSRTDYWSKRSIRYLHRSVIIHYNKRAFKHIY